MDDNWLHWFNRKRNMSIHDELNKAIFKMMNRIFNDEEGKPTIYGGCMFEEFSKIEMETRSLEEIYKGMDEPLVDILNDKKRVLIYMEIAGRGNNINIKAEEKKITVYLNFKKYVEIKLKCKIKPESIKAEYRNGVLEIIAEKESWWGQAWL
ncbi:MAG: hypothetical protein DRJ30_01000 [Candidatus Methanomethylicota archaeon]|nr:MAG: hypothetical protein DRJ30_01000 [Candidatus Verstraetearchaeota archaeon]